MFYEEEQLSKKLNCPNCEKRYDEPLLLPCANIICQRCVTSFKQTLSSHTNRFPCPLCHDYHDFPAVNFPVCKPVKDILNQQPKEVYRGILAEKLKANLNDIREKINDLNTDINEGIQKVKSQCQALRKEVNISTDVAFKFIEELNEELIKEIDNYENEVLKPYESAKGNDTDTEMSTLILELKKFHSQWEKYLKQLSVDDDLIENANDTAEVFKLKLDNEKSKILEFFYNQRNLEYEKNKITNSRNLLGNLKIVSRQSSGSLVGTSKDFSVGENSNLHSNTIKNMYTESKCLTGHTSGVSALVILNNGELASCSYDKTIRLWSTKTGEQIKRVMKGHTSAVSSLAVLNNGDLASGSWDTTIKVWNTNTCELKYTMHGHLAKVITLIVLENGDLASGSWDRKIKIWNLETGKLKMSLTGHSFSVISLAVLRNDELASGSEDATIKIWDSNTGELKKTLIGHLSVVKSLIALPDGGLASGSWDSTIKIWQTKYSELKRTLTGHTSGVLSLDILPNGNLVSASADKSIKIWNLEKGELKGTFIAHNDSIWVVIVLDDSGEVASCSADANIKIWSSIQKDSRSVLSNQSGNSNSGKETSMYSVKY